MNTPTKNGARAEYIVMATAKAKPGKEADLENALRDAVEPTRRQPGCLSFHLFRPLDAPDTIVAFECWATEADHDLHIKGAHVQKLIARFGDIIAEPPSFVRVDALSE